MSKRTMPTAVVLGMSPTGVAVMRSLGRQGVPVVTLDRNPWAIGRFSRYGRYLKIQGGATDWEENLMHTLLSLADGLQERPVLFCTEDVYLLPVSKHARAIAEAFAMPSSMTEETVSRFVDKELFYRMCLEHGVPLPTTFFPRSLEEVKACSRELHYPCIIKPAFGHLWRKKLRGGKVILVQTPEELTSQYERICQWDNRVIIQEVVPGPDDNIYIFCGYFDRHSEPLAIFTGRKLRQFPPGFGSASLAESTWQPEIAEMSISFMKKLGFHGICGTEYKIDPRDGKFKMMEVNQRPVLWCALIEASGIPLNFVAYQDLIGKPEAHTGRQKDGVKWVYTTRDLVTSFSYLYRGKLTPAAWLGSVRGQRVHANFARDDMRVMPMLPVYLTTQLLEHIRG